MLFMVLYQVSDDYIGVHQPSLCAHRTLARPRAAFAAASRISPKLIFLPFLLASAPFSDRVPELIAGFDLQRLANLSWNCCLSFPGDRGMGHESLLTLHVLLAIQLCLTWTLAGKDRACG